MINIIPFDMLSMIASKLDLESFLLFSMVDKKIRLQLKSTRMIHTMLSFHLPEFFIRSQLKSVDWEALKIMISILSTWKSMAAVYKNSRLNISIRGVTCEQNAEDRIDWMISTSKACYPFANLGNHVDVRVEDVEIKFEDFELKIIICRKSNQEELARLTINSQNAAEKLHPILYGFRTLFPRGVIGERAIGKITSCTITSFLPSRCSCKGYHCDITLCPLTSLVAYYLSSQKILAYFEKKKCPFDHTLEVFIGFYSRVCTQMLMLMIDEEDALQQSVKKPRSLLRSYLQKILTF